MPQDPYDATTHASPEAPAMPQGEETHILSKLFELNTVLDQLGADPEQNIERIVEHCCGLLDAACSLYNRLDDQAKSLCTWSGFNLPSGFDREDQPEGHICYEATIKGQDQPVNLGNLDDTVYATSDPNVKKYQLKSYLGYPVIVDGRPIGSLCVVDLKPRHFSSIEIQLISTLAKAVSLEENRLKAQRALRVSEERYRSLVENTLDAYYISEIPSGRFLFINQGACDLYGYTRREALNLSIWDLVVPEDHARVAERLKARLANLPVDGERAVYRTLHKNGSIILAEVSPSMVTYQGKDAVQGVIRDVTEHEKLQKQLQQAQRMEAIGTLAGGIAHDFNNLLMGVQGNASLALLDVDAGHPAREKLRNIQAYVRKATDLTKQLLALARGGKFEVKITDLNALLDQSSAMFGRTKKEIGIRKTYLPELWPVEVDRGQIEQVFLNIFVNAWQAMPAGGDLHLQTANVEVREEKAPGLGLEPGKYVQVSIRDTGIGMDANTLKRVFDPFFTTKAKERGTGLGLASAYGIVKNHGGMISAESTVGEGSTLIIYLPAAQSAAACISEQSGEGVVKGSETILLVDDEDMIVDVGQQILSTLGYAVMVAGSGSEAVKIYRQHHDRIDMVILDMVMPNMSGGETFAKLREMNPAVKILLSSGYSMGSEAATIMAQGCDGFIQKPFNVEQLSKKLRDILDAKTN